MSLNRLNSHKIISISMVLVLSILKIIGSSSNIYSEKHDGLLKNTDKKEEIKEIRMITNSNIYSINIGIGSPNQQRMQLVIDTQHKEISVMSKQCSECKDLTVFDEQKSDSFKVDSNNQTIYMNNVEFYGRGCNDKIYLSDDINNIIYPFFLVDNITHTNSYKLEGYLGLGFTKKKEENFVYYLKSKGLISNAVYSLLLYSPESDPKLYLGGYDRNLINETEAEKIIYTNVLYNEDPNSPQVEWYFSANSMMINDKQIDINQKMVLNTASNIIRIPKTFFFENIKNIFNKESQCQIWTDNVFHCKCNSSYQETFPTFKFSINNGENHLTISPDDYTTLDFSGNISTDSSAYCIIYISLNYGNDYWILGNNFINNFYTIFDIENSRLGFYDIKNLNVQGFEDILMLSFIIISASILFFIVIYLIYKRYMNRENIPERLLGN